MTGPQRARPGEVITAAQWNALVAATLGGIHGGQGIDVRRQDGRVTISLREDPAPRVYPARIVAQLGPGLALPSALNVGYRVARVGLPDDAAIDVPPDRVVGRPDYTGDVLLVPAPVGSFGLIREFRDDAGTSLPHFEVWKEAAAVELACPQGAGGSLRDGVFGVGFFGDAELVVSEMAGGMDEEGGARGLAAEATSMMDATPWDAEVEIDDLAVLGREYVVPVPRGATVASAQLVTLGAGGTAPKAAITLGRSNTGANPLLEGGAGLVVNGDLSQDSRVALKVNIDVTAIGFLHFRLVAPNTGSNLGSGVVAVRFERVD